ncbi:hypothetical protein Q9966_005300 [Columba livia]|nr:hypothetical protein Q9966_005300 [Columba livia]
MQRGDSRHKDEWSGINGTSIFEATQLYEGQQAPVPGNCWEVIDGFLPFCWQEYRAWTGVKPSKPIKTKQGFIIPEDHFVQETSYKADFKIPEVKTRFSPNPSAVFQAPSRILNV